MSLFGTCCSSFAALSRAAAKATKATLRDKGFFITSEKSFLRAQICERCALRVISQGVSYCGRPFALQVLRDPVYEGCGCSTRAKAADPKEHCPINNENRAADTRSGSCNCKWCSNSRN